MPDEPDLTAGLDEAETIVIGDATGAAWRGWRLTLNCGHLELTDLEDRQVGNLVSRDIAIELSKATGVPSSFWLDAERAYRADLARGAKDSSEEEHDRVRFRGGTLGGHVF